MTRASTVPDYHRNIDDGDISAEPSAYHRRLISASVRHILTANYDYALEKGASTRHQRSNMQPETKYSLFRRRAAGSKLFWHIHGEAEVPNTITLGYDQYSGYLQKIRSYATSERTGEKGSPFKRGHLDFDLGEGGVYSWLDVFFRDDIHVVGLGLDFTEIDLWWAVTYKRRLGVRGYSVGKTYFHDWHVSAIGEVGLAKRSLLTALGVIVVPVECKNGFESAYDKFLTETFDV